MPVYMTIEEISDNKLVLKYRPTFSWMVGIFLIIMGISGVFIIDDVNTDSFMENLLYYLYIAGFPISGLLTLGTGNLAIFDKQANKFSNEKFNIWTTFRRDVNNLDEISTIQIEEFDKPAGFSSKTVYRVSVLFSNGISVPLTTDYFISKKNGEEQRAVAYCINGFLELDEDPEPVRCFTLDFNKE